MKALALQDFTTDEGYAEWHCEQFCTVWDVGVGCQKYQKIFWKHSKAEKKGGKVQWWDIYTDCHCGNQEDERNIEKMK